MISITKRGVSVTALTLGTVQLGLAYGIANVSGKPDESKSHALLAQSEALGIKSFDTAAAYGDSEAVLGRYFKKTEAKDQLIVTKYKLGPDEQGSQAAIEKAVRGQLEQSLNHLGLTQVPIYLMHSPQDLHQHGAFLAKLMERLISEGLVGLAGASVYYGPDLDVMFQHDVFQATQIPISLFDQRLIASGHLAQLHERDCLVFARSVFLQGLFFMDPEQLPANLVQAAPYLTALRNLAAQEKLSVAQLALSFVRDLPEITSLVIGAETIEQVTENVRLIEGPGLSEKGQQEAKRLFAQVPDRLLNPALW